jgi:predicted transcriptional regulator of viral defense system
MKRNEPPTKERQDLSALARAAEGGLITVEQAAEALGRPREAASRRLASLARRGWLSRVRRGLYLVKPLDAPVHGANAVEDPWVLATRLFAPCYIGGWSAAEHWGLTEQIFRTTLVVTAAEVRDTEPSLGGHDFRLFRTPAAKLDEGLRQVWRGAERVAVSGPERTIVDGLRSPEICGGIRHMAGMLNAAVRENLLDMDELLSVAAGRASGAAWQRLGYLAERVWPESLAHRVAEKAHERTSAGYVVLDPAVSRRGRPVARWRVYANVSIDSPPRRDAG